MPSEGGDEKKLLWPLPKSPAASRQLSIFNHLRNKWIEHQLQRDKRKDGPVTQATISNQECPLLCLPAEVRNIIWELAIAPHYSMSDRQPIDIYSRFDALYPEHTLLLVSRNIYVEGLQMYVHAVKQFWMHSQFHLKLYPQFLSWHDQWGHLNAKVKSLRNEHLQYISRLVLHGGNQSMPTMTYYHGKWQGTWIVSRIRRIETRWVVLYGQLKARKVHNLLKNVKHEKLKLPVPWNEWLDAVLLPTDVDGSRYKAIRAATENETMNKRTLRVIVSLQWYTHRRYY